MLVTRVAVVLAALVALSSARVTYEITERWYGGFKLHFVIHADAAVDGWTIDMNLSGAIEGVQSDWVANARQVTPNHWQLTNLATDGHIEAGSQIVTDVIVTCHAECATGHSYTLKLSDGSGGGTATGGGGTATGGGGAATGGGGGGGASSNKDYADALAKSILFYDAQRSGKMPANNPISWRGDSALGDCVVGGWYDAGDHVKFGLPFGATTHLLLWGLHRFKDGYVAAGQLDMGYDMVKWATDYLLHAWNPQSKELVAQIGDGDADHAFWGRPEDMTMGRPCFKVGPGKPAADLMGEGAAALAAGYLVFKDKGDTDYANQLLSAAKTMYAAAKEQPGTYTNSVPNVVRYYGSTGYKDEMCLGGVWLYKATQDAQYLNDAKANHDSGTGWSLSWDDKRVACQLLLFEETKDASYKGEVENFVRDYMPGGSVPYTPCGLAWRDEWGANRYAGNAAFLALMAAEDGINPGAYRKWGLEQINFLLGDNHHDGGCFSYEIGHGTKSSRSPHHRGASCPNRPASCDSSKIGGSWPSPQLLNGALVGGPDRNGNYNDVRSDYKMNEVAIDYNSGFHSALAAINHLKATDGLPATNNKCPC